MTPAPKKKKYTPQILSSFKYRGFLVREVFNKKTKRAEFKARFQINNKEFNLTNDTRKDLEESLDEIYYQERRAKANLPVPVASPTLKELFDKRLPQIQRRHQYLMAKRTFDLFLSILPAGIKITELKRAHFQTYIDLRLTQTGKQSKRPITPQTVQRELSVINAAWRMSPVLFTELDRFEPFQIPKPKVKRKRRETLVAPADFDKLINYLLEPKRNRESEFGHYHRVRLAHTLQFAFETGFRRKEIAALRFSQYDEANHCLRTVKRFKTDTVTPFFPLSEKAEAVIKTRRALQSSEFIFTPDGEPIETNYHTLKRACKKLDLPYGRYADGFVMHDLRHSFATEIVQVTDIETAKSLTGHTGTEILTYLHTNQEKQRRAIEQRQKIDYDKALARIFRQVKKEKITEKAFVENIKKIFKI